MQNHAKELSVKTLVRISVKTAVLEATRKRRAASDLGLQYYRSVQRVWHLDNKSDQKWSFLPLLSG
jgi:hypothetical protein